MRTDEHGIYRWRDSGQVPSEGNPESAQPLRRGDGAPRGGAGRGPRRARGRVHLHPARVVDTYSHMRRVGDGTAEFWMSAVDADYPSPRAPPKRSP